MSVVSFKRIDVSKRWELCCGRRQSVYCRFVVCQAQLSNLVCVCESPSDELRGRSIVSIHGSSLESVKRISWTWGHNEESNESMMEYDKQERVAATT